jgi:septal ring factor EnvC (AmiA/AmiB activator)
LPRTGKTKRVLAKAARRCIDNNQKVLVLASTNLAVDNAVTAILEEGVEKEKVARIGVHSKFFFQKFPECCEECAFRHEIRQTTSQIKALEDNIAAGEKAVQLAKQIEDKATEREKKHRDLNNDNTDLVSVEESLRQSQATINQLQKDLRDVESRLDALCRERDQQSFPKLVSDIAALESEQTRSIKNRHRLEDELRNLGLGRNRSQTYQQ